MKIKKSIFLALIGVLMLGSITEASAKFFGTVVTSTSDWADGTNMYRETCTVSYVFWIAGSETCTTQIIQPM